MQLHQIVKIDARGRWAAGSAGHGKDIAGGNAIARQCYRAVTAFSGNGIAVAAFAVKAFALKLSRSRC